MEFIGIYGFSIGKCIRKGFLIVNMHWEGVQQKDFEGNLSIPS